MVKRTNGQVVCIANRNPPCHENVGTGEIDGYCLNTVSCANCKMKAEKPRLNENQEVLPSHWIGRPSAVTGQEVKDFAYEKKS
jgi:hypothetical protein